jgi:hypothetical protein
MMVMPQESCSMGRRARIDKNTSIKDFRTFERKNTDLKIKKHFSG